MLNIHRAERGDRLAAGLADLLDRPPADVLGPEVVAVPTRGVERWLAQSLSATLGARPGRADGVCANVEFPFPGALVGAAVAAATGVAPDHDPWAPQRAVWPLLEVVDANLGQAWLATLSAHLGAGAPPAGRTGAAPDPAATPEAARPPGGQADQPRAGRRFAAVRHVADLFDRYGVHRPAMLRAWAGGADHDGSGSPLAPDLAWQASLWRALRERIGAPSPAERMDEAIARLRRQPDLAGLPERFSLFGLTRLPASYLAVLDALAQDRDVHLWLLHPSPVLWAATAELGRAGRRPRLGRRGEGPAAALAGNPLLASWGRDAREMQIVLSAGAGETSDRTDEHLGMEGAPASLLGLLQAGVRADARPPGAPGPGGTDLRPVLDPDDRSLQVHSCHGRARQVEVMRDAILHLLADDPTLEPRDVIVMCPDIDSFAPLIQATFGLAPAGGAGGRPGPAAGAGEDPAGPSPAADGGAGAPGRELRVRLADRSLRQTNPVLAAVSQLLALAGSRVTASGVLDLAGTAPVRRRFGFDDDDLVRLNEWVEAAGIRWGMDGRHRAAWLLEGTEEGTWQAGMRRILLGVAMSEDGQRLAGGVLPLDDVDSGDIDLAGRVAELVARLSASLSRLGADDTVAGWMEAIGQSARSLMAAPASEEWQMTQLDSLLDDVAGESQPSPGSGGATSAGGPVPGPVRLGLAEIRSLLADRLRGRPTRANFRTGHLTMCTLVPMRSVPHRVVGLLGLDDGVFPRQTTTDGDDLVGRDPWVGDRDARSEDRQLLLDALLAAGDHLVITYRGRDERTNAPLPPAVPVGELLDLVDRTVRRAAAQAHAPVPGRAGVVVEHPLQPYDPRNFVAGGLAGGHPWSFDTVALAGALSLTGPRTPVPAFLPAPLPAPAPGPVEIDDLVRFFQHPTRAFLRRRLGVVLSERDEAPGDALPIEPDGLAVWDIGSRLLDGRLGGLDEGRVVAAERARGTIPPGALGERVLAQVVPRVEALVGRAVAESGSHPATTLDVAADLGGGHCLVGTVGGVSGGIVRAVTYSRLAPKHRLAAWLRVLALTATYRDGAFRAVTVGRGEGRRVEVRSCGLVEAGPGRRQAAARHQLRRLVDLYATGLCEPVPLYCATSAAYAAGGCDQARQAWTTAPRDFAREDLDPSHVMVLGGQVPFEDLLGACPGDGESGAGWAQEQPHRFGRLAHRLWDGLIGQERVLG
ncbi:MAG: exodeoxyribonuclease V subunit gamma [Acidimicrobiales bacterium]